MNWIQDPPPPVAGQAAGGQIISVAEVWLPLWSRIRLLFRGRLCISMTTSTEHDPGLHTAHAKVWIPSLRPRPVIIAGKAEILEDEP